MNPERFPLRGASLLEAIGNTPLVEIRRLNPHGRVRVFAKLESLNPGGSIKDRPALAMIEAAERSGELTPDKTVIEATSGNTGIGLALVCAVKGYRLMLAMSEAVSLERRRILQARGAEILLTPGHLGTDGAIEEVYRLVRENPERFVAVDQYNNEANWKAHYHGTAAEIWRQTGGRVTAVVAAMGTTGTLMGVSRRLKELNPAVRIVGVEPFLGHAIQGLKNLREAYTPGIYEKERLDEKINIEDEEAFETARRLAREEGLFVGMSSGAAMAGALRVAARLREGLVVVILPDGGERYLSTPLFAARETPAMRLHNTLTRACETLSPAVPGRVAVSTSGPNLQRPLSLTEARRFVVADLLCRALRARGLSVKQAIDLPDLDLLPDGGAAVAVERFRGTLAALGVRPAEIYARAGEHLEAMVDLARRLLDKGFAYEKLRSLYFDLSRAAGYGRLSGVDAAKVRVGASVDLSDYEKLNPRDFALLRRCRLADLKRGAFVKSPWGNVRPAWHLQSAAAATAALGFGFDLRVVAQELLFPHHENENAIAEAASGAPLARAWLAVAPVTGAAPPVEELLAAGVSGRAIRGVLLSIHYRRPLSFSAEKLEAAERALRRVDRCLAGMQALERGGDPPAEADQLAFDLRQGVRAALDDDLDLPAALAVIFKTVRRIHALAAAGALTARGARRLLEAFREQDEVLRLFPAGEPPAPDAELRELIAARAAARAAGDFQTADRLREELLRRGVRVQDPPARSRGPRGEGGAA